MSILLFAWFRAGFLSKMAVRDMRLAINSLPELAQSGMKLIIQKGGSVQNRFEGAPPGSLNRWIWESNILPYAEETLSDGKPTRSSKVCREARWTTLFNLLSVNVALLE